MLSPNKQSDNATIEYATTSKVNTFLLTGNKSEDKVIAAKHTQP